MMSLEELQLKSLKKDGSTVQNSLRLPKEDWPQDDSKSERDEKEITKEARKIVCTVKTSESPVEPKRYSSWRKLI